MANPKQNFLEFPLPLPLSPLGEREGVRGAKVLEGNLDLVWHLGFDI